MGPVSGWLWLAGAAVAVVGSPASRTRPHDHDRVFWGLVALTVAYSVACITRAIPWERASIGGHALAVVGLQPLVVRRAVADRRRGRLHGPDARAADALRRLLLPGALRVAAGGLEVATYASPLVTSPGEQHLLVGRTLAYARRLRRPRRDDPVPQAPPGRRRAPPAPHGPRRPADRPDEPPRLRRGADRALADGERFTLLLADVDSFKQINDRFGHTTGDRVLRELAAHASAAVRTGDCLARIGGDEFALVAPGAGSDAARRLADALREAGAHVDAGDGPLSLTVSFAVYPQDGTDRFTLMRALDRELHALKDARRTQRPKRPSPCSAVA